jgi:saccharopine dehydrogenase-like NADP-dependent oxidoreductase
MPTVLCLGGTGQFGLPIARHLAADAVVDRVIVAGRDLAKAVAVTVRYLLDGTVDTRGAATMAVAVHDAERFGRDYLALMGPEFAGLDLYSRRVVPA